MGAYLTKTSDGLRLGGAETLDHLRADGAVELVHPVYQPWFIIVAENHPDWFPTAWAYTRNEFNRLVFSSGDRRVWYFKAEKAVRANFVREAIIEHLADF